MIKNILISIFASIAIAILMHNSFTVSAENSSIVSDNGTPASADIASQSSNSTTEAPIENFHSSLNEFLGEAFRNGEINLSKNEDNSDVDYYSDNYYDTDGNATLINNQQIIYNSDEMQFISVTTKDGNVFYVLINYSDEDNIDNVYFLNKVDDYDLYALLYAGDESSGNITPAQAVANATGSSDSQTNSDNSHEDQSQAEQTVSNKSSNQGMMKNLIILAGAVVIGAVVFFIMLKSKKKNKPSLSSDDMYDFDDSDDIEINEDEE